MVACGALVVSGRFVAAPAHDYRFGDLEIVHPWARATAGLARKARLHGHIVEAGIVKMRPIEAIEVAPGAPLVLEPGGVHIMLMGLKAPLEAGTAFPLTLRFEKAGAIEIEVRVQSAGARTPDHQGERHSGPDKGS